MKLVDTAYHELARLISWPYATRDVAPQDNVKPEHLRELIANARKQRTALDAAIAAAEQALIAPSGVISELARGDRAS